MSSYVLSIIGTVILSSIFTLIIPEGKMSSTIKGVMKLVCVMVIVAPILRFFQEGKFPVFFGKNSNEKFFESVIDANTNFIEYYSEMNIAQAETEMALEIKKIYGVDVAISLEWKRVAREEGKYKVEGIYIEKICVSGLLGQSEAIQGQVFEYLSKTYCSEVLIE